MGEASERNREMLAYLQGIENNLKGRPCKNGHRKQRGGCIGRHDDCKNKAILDRIAKNAQDDPLFSEPKDVGQVAGESVETRIARLQIHYEGQPPVFEDREQIDPVNIRQNHGKTPLHLSVEAGDLEKTADLLANGANWELKDNNSKTPLGLAILLGNAKMTRLLKQHGVTE